MRGLPLRGLSFTFPVSLYFLHTLDNHFEIHLTDRQHLAVYDLLKVKPLSGPYQTVVCLYCSLLRRRVTGGICPWPAVREWITYEVLIITQEKKSTVTLLQHLHTIKSRRELWIKQRFHYAPRPFSWVTISTWHVPAVLNTNWMKLVLILDCSQRTLCLHAWGTNTKHASSKHCLEYGSWLDNEWSAWVNETSSIVDSMLW